MLEKCVALTYLLFYTQTEVVWDKNHYSMQVKGGLGMLTHLKPLRNVYNQTERVWDKNHYSIQCK